MSLSSEICRDLKRANLAISAVAVALAVTVGALVVSNRKYKSVATFAGR